LPALVLFQDLDIHDDDRRLPSPGYGDGPSGFLHLVDKRRQPSRASVKGTFLSGMAELYISICTDTRTPTLLHVPELGKFSVISDFLQSPPVSCAK
jgi:hypothetical protein